MSDALTVFAGIGIVGLLLIAWVIVTEGEDMLTELVRQKEPAVFAGTLAAALIAVVNVVLPEPLGQEAIGQINTVALILGPPILGLIIRGQVYSPARVAEIRAEARQEAGA